MISSTYNQVQEHADQIWKFERYRLVSEYNDTPVLPAPFSLIAYIFNTIRFSISFCYKKCKRNDVNQNVEALFDG